MKKVDLIHTTLLIVAVLAGYNALEFLITTVSSVTYIGVPYFHGFARFLYNLIVTLLFAAGSVILVRNGRHLAARIIKEQGDSGEASTLDLDRRNILFVLFIGIGIYVVMDATVYVISDIYDVYRTKVDATRNDRVTIRNGVLIQLLRLTLGAFLIYAAPTLTDFIENKIAGRLKASASQTIAPKDPNSAADTRPDTQSS